MEHTLRIPEVGVSKVSSLILQIQHVDIILYVIIIAESLEFSPFNRKVNSQCSNANESNRDLFVPLLEKIKTTV